MALVVVVVMILLAMAAGLLSLGMNSRIYSIRNASDVRARFAADAGLTMALFEMNEKLKTKPWSEDTLPQATNVSLPYCDAVCSYEVTGDLDSGYVITSAGQSGQAQRTVRSTIVSEGIFNNAVFTKADLILKSDTLIDGYNSLDALDTYTDAHIATQSISESTLILNSGVVVNGDVRIGRSGNPDEVIKDLGAEIVGATYAMTEKVLLPEITVPTTLVYMGTAISAKSDTATITPADSGTYTAINLKSGQDPGVLEISGGDVELHITGDIELGQSCEIVIKEGSSLDLYVDGDIHCRESSGINTESAAKMAKTFELYATGEDTQYFDIKANSEWIGVIYAPNAEVSLHAGGDIYGAVVADTFELKAGGSYHYDRALKKVSIEDKGVRLVVDRWSEFRSSPSDLQSDE
ncbi:collagen-binding domain-containing protein [Planctomycetota bacterium]